MQQLFSHKTQVSVPYGTTEIALELPQNSMALSPADPPECSPKDRFAISLESYLQSRRPNLSKPILVVTDKTRLCDYPEYLPVVTGTINSYRKDPTPFPIIIAYGTHLRQSDAESLASYGTLYRHWPFYHHDCTDKALFTELGYTSRNTPVRIRKDLLEASAIITMGPICHHYFAGYGGGRKLIFPGCGEKEAIYHNHGLYLDRRTNSLVPACQPGSLDNNPLAEDLFEYEAFLPATIAIHAIQNNHGRISEFMVGSGRQLFLKACERHGSLYEIKDGPFDTVVASAGGYPKDINFIQVHKAIHNSSGFVRDGGRLILFAECRDQIGSQTLLPWFGRGFNQAFTRLAEQYEGNGGTALAMMSKTKRITICLITALDDEICKRLQVTKWQADDARNYLDRASGQIAWIENGSLLVHRKDR